MTLFKEEFIFNLVKQTNIYYSNIVKLFTCFFLKRFEKHNFIEFFFKTANSKVNAKFAPIGTFP